MRSPNIQTAIRGEKLKIEKYFRNCMELKGDYVGN